MALARILAGATTSGSGEWVDRGKYWGVVVGRGDQGAVVGMGNRVQLAGVKIYVVMKAGCIWDAIQHKNHQE